MDKQFLQSDALTTRPFPRTYLFIPDVNDNELVCMHNLDETASLEYHCLVQFWSSKMEEFFNLFCIKCLFWYCEGGGVGCPFTDLTPLYPIFISAEVE